MDEEANYILRQAGYDIKPWEGFVQRGSTYGGISKSISHDKLKGTVLFTQFGSVRLQLKSTLYRTTIIGLRT